MKLKIKNLANKTLEGSKKIANKIGEEAKNIADTTSKKHKKFITSIDKSFKDYNEQRKIDSRNKRFKKYNPIFEEDYVNKKFNMPNLIQIVDDAVRKNIDVCEGAIGWISNDKNVEILHLYDEVIKDSGIKFIPSATCDALYYVDNWDRNTFIRTDCIFSKAHEERLAELENIAYCLGAKSCSIEITESNTEITKTKKDIDVKGKVRGTLSANDSYESTNVYTGTNERSGKDKTIFKGTRKPKKPKLKWFENDHTITNLVNMRLEDEDSIQSKTLELKGSSSATMSSKTATSIDLAIKNIGVKSNTKMESQADKESKSTLLFHIEF